MGRFAVGVGTAVGMVGVLRMFALDLHMQLAEDIAGVFGRLVIVLLVAGFEQLG